MKKIIIICVCFLTSYLGATLSAQDVGKVNNIELTKKINEFTQAWQKGDMPGLSLGVVSQGEILYTGGFGLADLETERSVNADTRFQMASLSKYFIAYLVYQLEEMGEISFNDPIQKYIPGLKHFEQKISIEHLLTQSSGLLDYRSVAFLDGWKPKDELSMEDAMRIINQQDELMFTPGSMIELSDSNISLLAKIIEFVTKGSIDDFAQKHLFRPLGMKQSLFCSTPNQLIENLAKPYELNDDSYALNFHNQALIGPMGMYSTAADMAIWYAHCDKVKGKDAKIIKHLNSTFEILGEQAEVPGYGMMTRGQQFVHAERGLDKFWQAGNTGAYASAVFRFEDQLLTCFVMGNDGTGYNGFVAMQIAEWILEDEFPEARQIDFKHAKYVNLDNKILSMHEGHYLSDNGFYNREIKLIDDTLRYIRSSQNQSALIPLSNHKFQMKVNGSDVYYVDFTPGETGKQFTFQAGNGKKSKYHAFTPQVLDQQAKDALTGLYINVDYNIVFKISLVDDALQIAHKKGEQFTMNPADKDRFITSSFFLNLLSFERDKLQAVKGFSVKGAGIDRLFFHKITPQSIAKPTKNI